MLLQPLAALTHDNLFIQQSASHGSATHYRTRAVLHPFEHMREAKDVMRLAKAGKIDPIPIEERSLDKAMATIEDLKNGKIIGRVVLTPG